MFMNRGSDYFKNLEIALERIKEGSFGVCKICDELIPEERMMEVPNATKCVECKENEKARLSMRILFVSAILVLTDQISKAAVRTTMTLYESIPVIPEFFHLTYITNDGMAFGINFPFGIYVFSAISLIFSGFLLWYLWTIKNHGIVIRIGIALILAGAIGNLIDRVFLGEVVDFLDFMIGDYHWYVFNIADSCVTVGMSFVLVDSLILERKRTEQTA